VGERSPQYAATLARRIVALIESIPQHPRQGRMVPEYGQASLRERIFHNYRIVYRLLQDDVVEVVTIVHGARMLPDLE